MDPVKMLKHVCVLKIHRDPHLGAGSLLRLDGLDGKPVWLGS